jgi:hypothetical protein
MPQISVPKADVSKIFNQIVSEGGVVNKSIISTNGKEVVLIYTEPSKTIDPNKPSGPEILTNAAPDTPPMNKVIAKNIDKPLVTEIPK